MMSGQMTSFLVLSLLILSFSSLYVDAKGYKYWRRRGRGRGRGRAGKRCKTDFEDFKVYDATIVYHVDQVYEPDPDSIPPFLSAMNSERNTLEYRQEAYGFFSERYGLDFDPTISGDQTVTDENGAQALVQAVKTVPSAFDITHQVYAIDAQDHPSMRGFPSMEGKFPVTNLALKDDGYFVTFLQDYMAKGTYGGVNGTRVGALTQVVAGSYNMVDEDDTLLDRLRYFADTPSFGVPYNGVPEGSDGAFFIIITCRIESDLFGTGLTRGLGEVRPLDAEGSKFKADFRYVMRFPSSRAEVDQGRLRGLTCDNVQ